MSPWVSVVIPHFERETLLRETLDSLRRQSFENWEAIIVDDQSSASCWRDIQRHGENPRIRVTQRADEPKGPSHCRNIGWRQAKAPWVLFLDSDDLLAPWCLGQRMESAAGLTDDGPVPLFPVMLFEQRPGDQNRLWNRLESTADALERFVTGDPPWHTSSPLWPRAILERINGFNEKIFYGDDAELHTRAILDGIPFDCGQSRRPDVFLRRSTAARITNTPGQSLLDSRLRRLVEGARLLERSPAPPSIRRRWSGQYFFEIEFLIYNVHQPRSMVDRVLEAWSVFEKPSSPVLRLSRAYAALAMRRSERRRLTVRLARRCLMAVLPRCFFPGVGGFESASLPTPDYDALRAKLRETFPEPNADANKR